MFMRFISEFDVQYPDLEEDDVAEDEANKSSETQGGGIDMQDEDEESNEDSGNGEEVLPEGVQEEIEDYGYEGDEIDEGLDEELEEVEELEGDDQADEWEDCADKGDGF
jgi:hypothetical protein